jgi:hypothetical protein
MANPEVMATQVAVSIPAALAGSACANAGTATSIAPSVVKNITA